MFARHRGASDPTIANIIKEEVGNPIIHHFAYWNSNRQSTFDLIPKTTESLAYCTPDERSFRPTFWNKCISDEETPQQCLDKWTSDFNLDTSQWIPNYNDCFVRKAFDQNFSKTHDYVLIYGGCDSQGKTLDIWYDYPASQWVGTTIASSAKTYKYATIPSGFGRDCTTGNTCHLFNIKSATPNTGADNAKDRIGFRIPKGGWNGNAVANLFGPTV